MFKHFAGRLLAVAIMCIVGAVSASAQGRVIVFGDSLSDNGNLFGAIAQPPVPYFQGRFSNGPVWVEQLFGPLNRPTSTLVSATAQLNISGPFTGNIDLAYGGARTDNATNLVNAVIPSISKQVTSFLTGGGVVGAQDTAVIWGGANNIFQFFDNTAPASITTATITANSFSAASSNLTSIGALAAAKPKTILVVNLPNLGAAPAFNGTTASSLGAFLATEVYNTVQATGVKAIAAANPGVNIIQMDVNAAFNVILANPAAFGFTNVTQKCFDSTVPSICATPNKFLFWDSVHPTQAGHALVAKYAGLLLDTSTAQEANTPLAEIGLWANTQATNSIMDRMQGFITGQYARRNGLHADVLGAVGNQDARGLIPSTDFRLYGVRGGFDRKFGTSLYGTSATILRGDISSSNLKADSTHFQADVYGSWSFGPMFVNADVGAGFTHLANIHRQTGFETVNTTANVNNLLVQGTLQAGYIANFGPISLMPTARIQAVSSYLGSIDESAPILAMRFDSRNTTAVLGGVRMRASMNTGPVTVFAEVGYEDYLSYSADSITAKLVNNTAGASTIAARDLDAPGLSFTAGVNGAITSNVHFDAQYGLALQNGNGQVHSGKLRVKVPF